MNEITNAEQAQKMFDEYFDRLQERAELYVTHWVIKRTYPIKYVEFYQRLDSAVSQAHLDVSYEDPSDEDE